MTKEKEKEQTNAVSSAVAAGVLAGAAGLAAGVLLAPQKGEETRANIVERAGELQAKGKDIADKVG
jgi:gas vesicle protein